MDSKGLSLSGFFRWNRNPQRDIEAACEALTAAGTRYAAIDAESSKAIIDNPGRMRELHSMVAPYGIELRDAHAWWGKGWDLNELLEESQFRQVESLMDSLGEFGVKTITFHIGAWCCYEQRWFGQEDIHRSNALRALERLLKSAERNRIIIAVENCFDPSTTAEEALAYVRKLSSPWLGLCLDCGHANLLEERAGREVDKMVGFVLAGWLPGKPHFTTGIPELMAPEIVTVHVHDNDGMDDLHSFNDGRGTIDWKRYLAVIASSPRLVSLQSEVEVADNRQLQSITGDILELLKTPEKP